MTYFMDTTKTNGLYSKEINTVNNCETKYLI